MSDCGNLLGIVKETCLTRRVNFITKMTKLPLRASKLGVYINNSRDDYIKSSVLLNVWMTSHHHWIKEGTVKDSAVPGTSSLSDSCLSVLLIARNDVTVESSNHSR